MPLWGFLWGSTNWGVVSTAIPDPESTQRAYIEIVHDDNDDPIACIDGGTLQMTMKDGILEEDLLDFQMTDLAPDYPYHTDPGFSYIIARNSIIRLIGHLPDGMGGFTLEPYGRYRIVMPSNTKVTADSLDAAMSIKGEDWMHAIFTKKQYEARDGFFLFADNIWLFAFQLLEHVYNAGSTYALDIFSLGASMFYSGQGGSNLWYYTLPGALFVLLSYLTDSDSGTPWVVFDGQLADIDNTSQAYGPYTDSFGETHPAWYRWVFTDANANATFLDGILTFMGRPTSNGYLWNLRPIIMHYDGSGVLHCRYYDDPVNQGWESAPQDVDVTVRVPFANELDPDKETPEYDMVEIFTPGAAISNGNGTYSWAGPSLVAAQRLNVSWYSWVEAISRSVPLLYPTIAFSFDPDVVANWYQTVNKAAQSVLRLYARQAYRLRGTIKSAFFYPTLAQLIMIRFAPRLSGQFRLQSTTVNLELNDTTYVMSWDNDL